jgi:hypothetical protein
MKSYIGTHDMTWKLYSSDKSTVRLEHSFPISSSGAPSADNDA